METTKLFTAEEFAYIKECYEASVEKAESTLEETCYHDTIDLHFGGKEPDPDNTRLHRAAVEQTAAAIRTFKGNLKESVAAFGKQLGRKAKK